MALLIDHLIRFSAFGILIVAALTIFRRGAGSLQAKLISLASLTGAAYLLCSSGSVRDALGQSIVVLLIVCLAGPWTFWTASVSLFKDGFRLTAGHWALLLLVEATGLVAMYGPGEHALILGTHNILTLSLFIHAALVAWRGRSADLIETRRRFRLLYVGGVAILGAAVSFVELIAKQTPAPAALETVAATAILALSLLLAGFVLKIDPETMFLPIANDKSEQGSQKSPHRTEHALLANIEAAMEGRRLYREAGLTIGRLAAELKLPEHRLRAAINGGLGYRNFNAFVNTYRVEAVKAALRDPERARAPVLTLALEAGFNSIAPFNRAFREATGMTPTAFRESAPDALQPSADQTEDT